MGKRGLIGVLVLVLIGISFVSSLEGKIDSEIRERISNGGKVNVIVGYRDEPMKKGLFFLASKEDKIAEIKNKEGVVKFSSGGFAVEVNEAELEDLLSDRRLVAIEPVRYFHLTLGETHEIINSSDSWNLQYNSLNFTGQGQTVCVIDTGVNFSHPDLIGKNLTCNMDCIDKVCVENCSIEDLNGHGTHVAGIVGANGLIKGIAPGANLIGLKVFPGSNNSGATTTGIKNAVDWCVENSEEYNISVISMSLGTDTQYATNCDDEFPTSFDPSITNAYDKNISVVVATGNDNNVNGISSPACISEAIPVADTYDANLGGVTWSGACTDLTTAVDKIVCHANRNSLVQLLAPGAIINSTNNSFGGYVEMSGTSMAAPVVAGAIAVIKQMLNLTTQTKTPAEIEDALNDTGKVIYDSSGSGENFSRIDVYEAILSLDNIDPSVSLVTPSDNKVNLTNNQSFICNATDWQLNNVTFKIWNSSGIYNESNSSISGAGNQTQFNLTEIPLGTYTWNCEFYDVLGNFDSASENYTITIGGISVDLASPTNVTYTNVNETNFTCSATSEENYELTNISFYLWGSGELVYNETVEVSGVSNESIFTYNLSDELDYTWSCLAFNNNTNSSWAENFTISFDVTSATISSVSAGSITSSSAIVNWTTTNDEANSTVYYGTTTATTSSAVSSEYLTSHLISLTNLESGRLYYYNVSSCDRAGNCETSSQYTFTTSSSGSGSPGGGGTSGGGGGDTGASYFPTESELAAGYEKQVKKDDKIYVNVSSGKHIVSVSKIATDYAEIKVNSEPIVFNLSVGESKKMNLSSTEYYELLVGLSSIQGTNVTLNVQKIFEVIAINQTEAERNANYTTSETGEEEREFQGSGGEILKWISILVLVGICLVVVRRLLNPKKLKEQLLSSKDGKKSKKTKP